MFGNSIERHIESNTQYYAVSNTFNVNTVFLNGRFHIVSEDSQEEQTLIKNASFEGWVVDHIDSKGVLIVPSKVSGECSHLGRLKQVTFSRKRGFYERVSHVANVALSSVATDYRPMTSMEILKSVSCSWSSQESITEKKVVNYISPLNDEKDFFDVIRFLPKQYLSVEDIQALDARNMKEDCKTKIEIVKKTKKITPKINKSMGFIRIIFKIIERSGNIKS
ncbi:MAG: hypothetical protein VX777_03570 [Chlamydiota bacterium]|nr:hypothetical protein [Chlamydiota bacterium]